MFYLGRDVRMNILHGIVIRILLGMYRVGYIRISESWRECSIRMISCFVLGTWRHSLAASLPADGHCIVQ